MIEVIKDRVEYNLTHHFLIRRVIMNPEYNFHRIGLSSMEKLELLLYIELEFGIEFTEQEVDSIDTIGLLITSVHEHYALQHHFSGWNTAEC